MSNSPRPAVFQYSNYRAYLGDLFAFLKKEKKVVTYRWLAKRGGFTSPNFIKLVIDGDRNLSDESIAKIAQAFAIGRNELAYFKNLVHFTQADSPQEKELYGRKLANNRNATEVMPLKGDQFNYYSTPLNVLIRELITLNPPPQNVEQIQTHLPSPIEIAEIEKSLKLLERLELITRKKDGQGWAATANSVWSGDEVFSQAVSGYHRHMIAEGSQAIQKTPPEERDISSVTIGVSEANFARIKKLVQDFRQEIIQLSDEDTARDRVYQMNIQLFPLSKRLLKEPK